MGAELTAKAVGSLSRLRERGGERANLLHSPFIPSPGSRHSASQTHVNALVALATLPRKRGRGRIEFWSCDEHPFGSAKIARFPGLDSKRRRTITCADESTATPSSLMRRLRRTKIVATLGPASSDRAVIGNLFRAGADVFRINMSHTTHER